MYLLSEFLDGPTLERNCTRSFRLSDGEAEGVLRVLLRMTEPERDTRFAAAIDVARALGPGAPSLPPGAWRPG